MGRLHDTDRSDSSRAPVEPHLPPAKSGGRPRITRLHVAVDAIFHLLRADRQWWLHGS